MEGKAKAKSLIHRVSGLLRGSIKFGWNLNINSQKCVSLREFRSTGGGGGSRRASIVGRPSLAIFIKNTGGRPILAKF